MPGLAPPGLPGKDSGCKTKRPLREGEGKDWEISDLSWAEVPFETENPPC